MNGNSLDPDVYVMIPASTIRSVPLDGEVIERTFRCNGPECERHVVSPPEGDRNPFMTVTGLSAGEGGLHFCGWDCLLKYGAKFDPEEVIEL